MIAKVLSGFFILFYIFNFINSQGTTCQTKENKGGVCKILKDCPEVIDMLRHKKKGYTICDFDPITVCCPNSNADSFISTSDFSNRDDSQSPRKLHEKKCTEYAEAVYVYEQGKALTAVSNGDKVDKCGLRNIPLIVGGTVAAPREFPHMALIGYNQKGQKVWKCGGSLISDQYILTAAHCIETIYGDAKYVLLGELDISRTDEESDPEEFDIIEKIPHKFFNSTSKYHDIALFKLDRKVNLNPYKRPACLPSSFEGVEKKTIVTGWGHTRWLGQKSNTLQKVVLDKFNITECNRVYTQRQNQYLIFGVDEKTQICAGSYDEEKDTCQGDSGGPMQVFHHSEYCMYTLVGVTSFGILCGNKGIPGIYTRIFPYNSWIESVVWKQ